jgi:SAM-dependent methyltransferase
MKLCLACKTTFADEGWRCPKCGFTPEKKDGIVRFSTEVTEQTDGFHPSYFADLAELEKNSFWFKARNKLISWVFATYFPNANRFLEVGIGTGYVMTGLSERFTSLELHGSELFMEGLQFAKQRLPNATLYQMDARQVPFLDHFDVIGAFDVLEHIEEDEVVLSELLNAVHPGGGIIVTVPQHQSLWSVVDEISYHKRRYSRKDLIQKIKRAGFEPVFISSFVSFLFPLLLLTRLTKRGIKAEDYDRTAEHRASPRFNGLLDFVMSVERALITRGLTFSFGGSLLVAARKPVSPP